MHNAAESYYIKYKTALCKFFGTTSKIRAMGIRAIGNRVSRGMPVALPTPLSSASDNVIDKQIQGCHYLAKNVTSGNFLDEYFTANMQTFPKYWMLSFIHQWSK